MLEKLNPKQEKFILEVINNETKRINLLQGSVRSGKTYISLIAWIIMVCEYPKNALFLMVGKTLTSLKRNCLCLLEELCPKEDFSVSISKKEAILFGRRIFLEGVNDKRAENKIRGMTLQAAYCDELTLFSEDFFSMLLSRLTMPNAKLVATTNPDTPYHWLMKNYINRQNDISMKIWDFYLDDNETIPKEIIENMKKEYTGVFYDRFILGKWVNAEGLIYRSFVDNKNNIIANEVLENISFITIGIDYGASKSKTVFIASGISERFEKVYILMEKSVQGIHDPEELYNCFENFYKDVLKTYGKPNMVFADYGALGQVLTAGLKNRCYKKMIPINIYDCVKNTIMDRISLTCKLFAQSRLKILKNCSGIICAFENSIWDSKKIDTRLDDGTIEIDYLDAFEYSINNFADKLIISNR